jgi:diaminopimelate decarboxylase
MKTIQIHSLFSLPVHVPNRGADGLAKRAIFGGVERIAQGSAVFGTQLWFIGGGPAGTALVGVDPDGRTTTQHLAELGSPSLIAEPGRSLMAGAGVTVAEVRGTKDVLGNRVVSLDVGITNHGTNLITPDVFPAAVLPRRRGDKPVDAFLAGRLCFSGDMLSKVKVRLNRAPRVGERLAIYLTGAYSADHFASNSCGFPLPGKLAVDADGRVEVWRRPEAFEDVFGSAASPETVA